MKIEVLDRGGTDIKCNSPMHCLYLCQFFIQLSDFCTILEPELCTILGFLVNTFGTFFMHICLLYNTFEVAKHI